MIDARARISRLLAIHVLLFLALLARRPEALLKAQFWAEDGAVFFADQLRFGFLGAISSTYAGYYHVLPRLLAGSTSWLPAEYVPLAYNLTALLIAAICSGMFAWPICRNLIPSDAVRTVACFVAVTAVYAGNEVIGDLTNLQWFLLVAAVFLVSYVQTPEQKPGWVYISVAVAGLLIALSAPLALILAPWLVWQAFRRTGLARWPALCILFGALFETWTFLRSGEAHGSLLKIKLSLSFVAVVGTEISRPVLGTLLGHQYLTKGGGIGVVSKFIAALMIVCIWLTRLYSGIDARSRTVLTVVIYLSLAPIAVVMTGRNLSVAFTDPGGFRYLEGERYFFVSAFLFVFLAAFSLDRALPRRKNLLKGSLLVLLFSYGMIKNFELPTLPDLSWKSYSGRIDDWTMKKRRGEHVPRLIVPINPAPFTIILE